MRKACLESVYQLAKTDKRVVFIGSDIGAGTLDHFKKEMPDRFFMEGVSEAHLVGMMAGLALSGKIPYFNTIATFITRRAFEQVLLDAGLHKLNIRFIGSGGGVVYAPLGPTHLALEDIAVMRAIPGMTVLAPCDAEEARRLMSQTLKHEGPIYIRLAKGGDPVVSREENPCVIGKSIVLREGEDVLLVSTGITAQLALAAADLLKEKKIQAGVLHFHTLKPFDVEGFVRQAGKARVVIAVEEHTVIGGLGSAAAESLAEANFKTSKKPKPY